MDYHEGDSLDVVGFLLLGAVAGFLIGFLFAWVLVPKGDLVFRGGWIGALAGLVIGVGYLIRSMIREERRHPN